MPGRSYSPDATHHDDASAKVHNILNVVIDGQDASALLDSSADYSVLSCRHSRHLRKVMMLSGAQESQIVGGHLITPVGMCTASVDIHGAMCPVEFVILRECARDVILGVKFLCEYGAVLYFGENRLPLRTLARPQEEPQTASVTI